MDKVNVNLLKFLAHYDYLDFNSHDLKDSEAELPNKEYEDILYHDLFNQLVEPKIREFRVKDHPEDEIVFNFFCRSDNPQRILVSFYKPDVDFEVMTDIDGTPVLVNTLLMLRCY